MKIVVLVGARINMDHPIFWRISLSGERKKQAIL